MLRPTHTSVRGFALAVVIANAVIIATGEAVRLSASGLGCPDWPQCTKTSVVAAHSAGQTTLNTWIEFGNRLLNFPLVASAWRYRLPVLGWQDRAPDVATPNLRRHRARPRWPPVRPVLGGLINEYTRASDSREPARSPANRIFERRRPESTICGFSKNALR